MEWKMQQKATIVKLIKQKKESEFEEWLFENVWSQEKKAKGMERNGDSLLYLWNNIKRANIWVTGLQQEEKDKGVETLFKEIITKNLSKSEEWCKYPNTER